MVAKASSSPPKSSSQIELSETFSHSEVSQVTPSSSDDFEVEAGLSRSSSKEQQEEVATLIDIVAPIDFDRQQAKFSFKELARFFGPGLLTCVAYVVKLPPLLLYVAFALQSRHCFPQMCMLFQDPGNLEADLQAGGFAGYALLWLFLVCTIMVSAR